MKRAKKQVRICIGDLWRGNKTGIFISEDDIILVTDVKSIYGVTNILFHYIDTPEEEYDWDIKVFRDTFKKIS